MLLVNVDFYQFFISYSSSWIVFYWGRSAHNKVPEFILFEEIDLIYLHRTDIYLETTVFDIQIYVQRARTTSCAIQFIKTNYKDSPLICQKYG